VTGTGGGYGDPFERPADRVRQDVRDGYLTVEMAEKDHGVVLDPATLEVEGLRGRRQDT
jgi:N-methylhydantoinase B